MISLRPIKILYVISSLANEGPTRILLNLVKNIDRSRFDPQVVTLTPERDSSLIADFEAAKVPVLELSGSTNGVIHGSVARMAAFKRLADATGADIVHAHCPRSLLTIVAGRPRKAKLVYTLHVYPNKQYKIIHGALKGPIITAVSNALLRFVDRPIACSESVREEYILRKRMHFPAVNNGIEPIDLQGISQREEVLRGLGLDPLNYYLLFVGRLSAEKRIVELVKTFGQADIPNVELIIVGNGPDMHHLRQISGDKVHLMGYHSDVRPFLAASDCYISPSSTEGLANSLLEAMSTGLPCLLSEIPSHRFVMDRCDGFVGTCFDPLSQTSLRQSLTTVRDCIPDKVHSNVRSNFDTFFNSRVMAAGYEKHYMELVHETV